MDYSQKKDSNTTTPIKILTLKLLPHQGWQQVKQLQLEATQPAKQLPSLGLKGGDTHKWTGKAVKYSI